MQKVIVKDRSAKEKAVATVEYPSVARDESRAVFGARPAFPHGFHQVPQDSAHGEEDSEYPAVCGPQLREEPGTRQKSGQQAPENPRQRPLYGLLRGDSGGEEVSSSRRAHVVGCRIPSPDHQKEKENQIPAQLVSQIPEPHQISQEHGEVKGSEDGRRIGGQTFLQRPSPPQGQNRDEDDSDHQRRGKRPVGLVESEENR